MKQFPSVPRAENAPSALFDSGHLWIQEKLDGANFRFRLRESGALQFGDRSRTYDADEIPEPYHHAVRHVRERFDREALRNSVEDVESVVFFGEAMHRHAIDYDWDRTPSFLGFDVWEAGEERFLPPDAVEQIYDRLGLQSVNTLQKEVRAVDFDPASYEIPDSAWYDGPAEGVVVRNKTGQRAAILHPDFREADDAVPVEAPADELARKYATRHCVEKVVRNLEDREHPVTFDAVYDRVVEAVVREEHHRLFHDDRSIDVGAFRSEVAARTQELLDGVRSDA
ncbi:RNA ligase family protein [Halorussus salinisoli]|uniref:RNA ligase family protein n=1 Tax=Halorussus salinisoli TaxID=2558242 RepID=UPI0010C191E2|nr:RNA ligase family protein [Halorussus salinisoli]